MLSATLRKLRYRPGMRVGLHGAPAGFEADVRAAGGVARAPARARNLDLVQAFFTRRAHLERSLARLTASLAPRGIFWVCYPKGQPVYTDLSRDLIRRTVARLGHKAVAIVAVDGVWSALRVKLGGVSGPSARPR